MKGFADDNLDVAKCNFSLVVQKTLWEKEKMLVTSIFSFSYNGYWLLCDKNIAKTMVYIEKGG